MPSVEPIFYLSKSGDKFLCSCPNLYPSFVVSHTSKETALKYLQAVVYSISTQVDLFSCVEMVFKARKYELPHSADSFYCVECPEIIPGWVVYGSCIDEAVSEIKSLINKSLQNVFGRHELQI